MVGLIEMIQIQQIYGRKNSNSIEIALKLKHGGKCVLI